MSGTEFDQFLKKFIQFDQPIKADDFLFNLLVGEKSVNVLRDDFKSKLLIPLFTKFKVLSEKIDKNNTELNNSSNNLHKMNEGLDSNNFYINKNLISLKKISEELEKTKIPSQTLTNIPKPQETPKSLTETLTNIPKPQETPKSLTETLTNIPKPQEIQKEEGQEQKTFGPKETIISFSSNTNDFLSNLVNKILTKKEEEPLQINQEPPKKGGIFDFIKDLITGLPMLIAAVGGLTTLAGIFWPEIKKFIGDKFGDKAAEVFDKFQGTVNALGKFLTVGGLQLKFGAAFKTLGDMLGSVSDNLAKYATDMFKGVMDNIIGESAEAGGKIAGSTVGKALKGVLAKGGSVLLKGVSKVALKGIPLIGTVISFADAWGRFKEGEYAQGIIDIGAGLAGLVPGIGTALSIGLSVMNAFIDFKSEEEKEKLTQQTLNVSSMLLKGAGFFSKIFGKGLLSKLPLIGSLFSFANAWQKIQQNNIIGGTLDITSGIASLVPGVGLPLSIGIDILSSFIGTQEAKESGVQKTGFDIFKIATKAVSYFAKFGKPFLKRIPLIGSLLSFGSAWDNIKGNNILEGLLDVASGVASLFPGVGTVISLGVDLVNSFLVAKDDTGKRGIQKVGDWFVGVWEWFKGTSFGKTIFNLADGIKNLFSTDNITTGLKMLNNVPYFGSLAGVLLSIMETVQPDANSKSGVSFSFQTLAKNLKKNLFKNFSGLIPEGFGMRKWFADLMGVDYNEKTEEITNNSSPQAKPKREFSSGEIQAIKNLPTSYNEEEHNKVIELNQNLEKEKGSYLDRIKNLKEETPKNRGDAAARNADIQRIQNQIKEIESTQLPLAYKVTRFDELKENKKITTAEDYGVTQDVIKKDVEKQIAQTEQKLAEIESRKDKTGLTESTKQMALERLQQLKKEKDSMSDSKDIKVQDASKGVDLFNDAIRYSSFAKQMNSMIYQPSESSSRTVLDKNDNWYAMKSGGAIDNTFKDLKSSLDFLSSNIKNLYEQNKIMQQKLNSSTPQQSPVIVNNNSTTQSTDTSVKFNASRDEVFNSRMDWVRNNPYIRLV